MYHVSNTVHSVPVRRLFFIYGLLNLTNELTRCFKFTRALGVYFFVLYDILYRFYR